MHRQSLIVLCEADAAAQTKENSFNDSFLLFVQFSVIYSYADGIYERTYVCVRTRSQEREM